MRSVGGEGNRNRLQNDQACSVCLCFVWQQGLHLSGAFWHHQNSIEVVKAFVSLCAVMFCISLFSLLVFLRYQIYYGYPLETYLEFPVVIAQGNFCKPCFGNEVGLIQHSKSLHVGTVLHCSDAGVGGKRKLTSHIQLNSFKCHWKRWSGREEKPNYYTGSQCKLILLSGFSTWERNILNTPD